MSGKRPRAVTPVRLTEVVLCVVATIATALLYGRFFGGAGYLPSVCAAAVTGAAIASVAGPRRWGPYRTSAAAVGGFVLLAVYGVFRDTVEYGLPTRATAEALRQGVVGGWVRMLAVAPPAEPTGELLVTPVLITWTAAFAATVLALRTRAVFAPVVPAVVAFAAALVLVGRQPGIQVLATAVFLVAVFSLVLLRAGDSSPVAAGRLAFGGPVVVVVAVLGVLGGVVLPLASGEQRFDPRTLVPPPVRVTEALTPLAGLKAQLREQPPRTLFTVGIAGGAEVDRIRVAALDAFDGVTWTSRDRFLVAGNQLAADPAMTRGRPVSARVTIEGLAGPYLPVVGWPVQLDLGDTAGFSTSSGVLVGTRRTPRGTTYTVVGQTADRDGGLVRTSPSGAPGYTALPSDMPPLLETWAQRLTAGETRPYGKLVAIEEYLRGLPYRLDVPPGHSYAALVRMLTASGEGYAEQHASAFAVLARVLGFPARVAVGYRLDDSSAGTHEVTTQDAHAWAEVHFDGYGWVAFEPTDLPGDTRERPESPAAAPRQSPNPPLDTPPPVADRPSTRARPDGDQDGATRAAVLAAGVLAAVVLLGAAAVLAAKTRRRRVRRLAPGNAARVTGAWLEAVDRLVERGIAVPASLTAHEVAERAVRVLGAVAEPLVPLASIATAAVYAPVEPDDHAVEEAWRHESALRRGLYPGRLSPRGLIARLDPRPLLAGLRASTHAPEPVT
ncbi:transglutaminase TgpA family protein [Actinophytocola oryzae]|uniref:transglutaminase TgpA family protein n=1 Tax=Actinophytocola oryzae TaxID=502181 RepID=UPI001414D902|nr:transglutaminaseTgpA domain-containing protein [Actinophytocola oryzae]